MTAPHTEKRCPVCRGRGAIRCDCWPGDCICGCDDEPCDNCEGTGWIDTSYDDEYDPFYAQPEPTEEPK